MSFSTWPPRKHGTFKNDPRPFSVGQKLVPASGGTPKWGYTVLAIRGEDILVQPWNRERSNVGEPRSMDEFKLAYRYKREE